MRPSTEDNQTYGPSLPWAKFFTLAFWRVFYSRPCGARDVLRLTFPFMVSFGTITIVTLTDRLCLSWYDPYEMNAAFQSSCLFWTLAVFPTGIGTFVNTFVSQYNGAGQNKRIGPVVWQGVFIGIAFGALVMAITPLIGPFFRAVGATDSTAALEQKYWAYMSLGAIAAIALEPLCSFFEGLCEPKTVMIFALAGMLVNVVLDPILIFGVCGRLRLGLVGAGIASAVSFWTMFLLLLYAAFKRDATGELGFRSGCRFNMPEMKRLTYYGSMSAAQQSVEHVFFGVFTLLMGWLGDDESAATAIGYNLNSLLYMPAAGMGLAATTLVGNYLGAGKPRLARRATFTSIALAASFAAVFSVAFLAAPGFFVGLYGLGDPDAFEKIRPIAVMILRIVAVYLYVDACNLIFTGALRGAGDARFIMRATFIIVGLALAALFIGVRVAGFGVYWCWWALTGYLTANTLVFFIRFARGKWATKTLVDATPHLVDSSFKSDDNKGR
ncbi:MAG: MATE family efflux transporter [Thermoguttaceae bacterium]|nr:MATE family efflux transporter [Thermoguttaceae bacterium]